MWLLTMYASVMYNKLCLKNFHEWKDTAVFFMCFSVWLFVNVFLSTSQHTCVSPFVCTLWFWWLLLLIFVFKQLKFNHFDSANSCMCWNFMFVFWPFNCDKLCDSQVADGSVNSCLWIRLVKFLCFTLW